MVSITEEAPSIPKRNVRVKVSFVATGSNKDENATINLPSPSWLLIGNDTETIAELTSAVAARFHLGIAQLTVESHVLPPDLPIDVVREGDAICVHVENDCGKKSEKHSMKSTKSSTKKKSKKAVSDSDSEKQAPKVKRVKEKKSKKTTKETDKKKRKRKEEQDVVGAKKKATEKKCTKSNGNEKVETDDCDKKNANIPEIPKVKSVSDTSDGTGEDTGKGNTVDNNASIKTNTGDIEVAISGKRKRRRRRKKKVDQNASLVDAPVIVPPTPRVMPKGFSTPKDAKNRTVFDSDDENAQQSYNAAVLKTPAKSLAAANKIAPKPHEDEIASNEVQRQHQHQQHQPHHQHHEQQQQQPKQPVIHESRRRPDYASWPELGQPREGDFIAFKTLVMSLSYTPEISDFQEGLVTKFDSNTQMVEIKRSAQWVPVPEGDGDGHGYGKFEIEDEELTHDTFDGDHQAVASMHLSELLEARRHPQ